MSLLVFVAAALLLAVERVTYVLVWRNPSRFVAVCDRRLGGMDPVDALEWLFRAFKGIQVGVFVAWCLWHDGGALRLHGTAPLPLAVGLALVAIGQALNYAVFRRLGRVGVFYGVRFGHEVPWCTAFPFSVIRHPQYVGALLSIWGLFLVARYPQPDWLLLPLLETVYYGLGARFESDREQA